VHLRFQSVGVLGKIVGIDVVITSLGADYEQPLRTTETLQATDAMTTVLP
jgi:hypothetical protein